MLHASNTTLEEKKNLFFPFKRLYKRTLSTLVVPTSYGVQRLRTHVSRLVMLDLRGIYRWKNNIIQVNIVKIDQLDQTQSHWFRTQKLNSVRKINNSSNLSGNNSLVIQIDPDTFHWANSVSCQIDLTSQISLGLVDFHLWFETRSKCKLTI